MLVGMYILFLSLFILVILYYCYKVELEVKKINNNQIPEGVPPFWWEHEFYLNINEKGSVFLYILYVHIYHIFLKRVKGLNPDNSRKEDCRNYKNVLLSVNKLFHKYKNYFIECNNHYYRTFHLHEFIHEVSKSVRYYLIISKYSYRHHKVGKDQTKLLLKS